MRWLNQTDCEKLLSLTSDLYASEPGDALRRQLLQSLRALIPHEVGACHWMQPARRVIAAWYEPEQRAVPAAHQHFWRLIHAHPLNPLLFAHPGRAWKLSDAISTPAFQRTELYAALYRPLGIRHEMSALLPDQAGRHFLVSLHRERGDFTERDRTLMNVLLPHIARAQRRLVQGGAPRPGVDGPFTDEQGFHDWIQACTDWQLSRRESAVLFWLCQGKTNSEIGGILGIAGRTAETHALRAYPKIGVENRYAAIAALNRLASTGCNDHAKLLRPNFSNRPTASLPTAACA